MVAKKSTTKKKSASHDIGKSIDKMRKVPAHKRHTLKQEFSSLEDALQKKIEKSGHLPEEAEAYTLTAKLASFCREILYGVK